MKFIKTTSTRPVINHLVKVLNEKLDSGKSVLWLLPGGSSIKIAADVSKKLKTKNLKNLFVTLSDERYGAIGHKDSNWRQLDEAGFKLLGANLQPVLIDKSLPETEKIYGKVLEKGLKADFKLGFIGLGPDGHAAGIKPKSPAVFSNQLAVGYRAPDFLRLTITPKVIQSLDEVVSYAIGEDKWPVFDELETDIPVAIQPAQVLKEVPTWTIYNDYKGEEPHE